ncbi:MAG TPA: hypothetical protein D7I05_05945 [Candidatus Poseidoniales archaeon]|nr:MAG TPA: hypothetical protein D7I05_05945 [Candidatus Poseidoniales archaeon]
MSSGIGWSRSRRWLLETCPRRFVLTYPGPNGEGGPAIDPPPRLRLKRLIDGVRKDLFEDRSEGHAWSSRLHRVVLEQRMDAAGPALELDAVARRREARHEVRRIALLLRHPWISHHLPVGTTCHVPHALRSVKDDGGHLWAAPNLVTGGAAPRAVLLRQGRCHGAVDDLEAALSLRWAAHGWPTSLNRTVTVMRWFGGAWIHHMVFVTPDLETAAEGLLDHDRRAMAALRRRWCQQGLASLPLASSKVHCRQCPFEASCPGVGSALGVPQARLAPSKRS